MNIRPFRPNDQDRAATIIQQGLTERWGSYDHSFNPDLDDLWANYMTGGACFLVAETSDGLVVGTGALVPEDPSTSRIVRMSVARSHRRTGIARELVDALIDSRPDDVSSIAVETDTPWMEAVALYQDCGFTIVAADAASTHFRLELS
ncbi:MAG: GNAT family N-acetyltransferase [Acidimicrobiales bacterium]